MERLTIAGSPRVVRIDHLSSTNTFLFPFHGYLNKTETET